MSAAAASLPDEDALVDLVLFEVAGTRYGADLTQVRRVDRVEPLEVVGEGLGRPAREVRRALVYAGPDGGERRLAIDQLLGVRSVRVTELRRLPPAASRGSALSIGAWLDGNEAVLLVDLHAIPHVSASGSPR